MRMATHHGGSARGCALAATILVLVAAPACANDGATWPNFPTSGSDINKGSINRAFVKEWESTPPKGFPTLSHENLAPMKAAIKRYTQIVAEGGWLPIPDTQL